MLISKTVLSFVSELNRVSSGASHIRIDLGVTMWPSFLNVIRPYMPFMGLPVFILIGGIGGYTIKQFQKVIPFKEKGIQEEQDERKLRELEEHDATEVAKLIPKQDIPKTILDRNDKSKPV